MTSDAGQAIRRVDILPPNAAKARFGVAYVRAICSHAGVGFAETSPDEDYLAIDGRVQFSLGNVGVQIKCTGQFRIDGGDTASWPAEAEWWRKWHGSKEPVYFIVVMVDPDDQSAWLEHLDGGTLSRSAAFWVRVDRMSEGPSITVPKAQRLTAATMATWAADVDAAYAHEGLGDELAS